MYILLEHTADLKIKVFGQDLAELFVNSALAMQEEQRIEIDSEAKEENQEEIEIKAMDKNSLFVDWLSEILFRADTNKKFYKDIKIEEISETSLKAKIKGTPMIGKGLDIKAVTYHDLTIEKKDDRWEAVVIFDI